MLAQFPEGRKGGVNVGARVSSPPIRYRGASTFMVRAPTVAKPLTHGRVGYVNTSSLPHAPPQTSGSTRLCLALHDTCCNTLIAEALILPLVFSMDEVVGLAPTLRLYHRPTKKSTWWTSSNFTTFYFSTWWTSSNFTISPTL